ncbi:hypothetical protein FB451DRAFT_1179022 [Mycena latifolia]|nr:hypothetical protein FB451DRAFT_1179022 [Mycena latifolia]
MSDERARCIETSRRSATTRSSLLKDFVEGGLALIQVELIFNLVRRIGNRRAAWPLLARLRRGIGDTPASAKIQENECRRYPRSRDVLGRKCGPFLSEDTRRDVQVVEQHRGFQFGGFGYSLDERMREMAEIKDEREITQGDRAAKASANHRFDSALRWGDSGWQAIDRAESGQRQYEEDRRLKLETMAAGKEGLGTRTSDPIWRGGARSTPPLSRSRPPLRNPRAER